MLSDWDEWTDDDKLHYRNALGLDVTTPIDWRNGSAYAIAVARSRITPTDDAQLDVFLDPDTGIGSKMPSVTRRAEFVYTAELKQLIDENPDRVLVVYQHRTRDVDFPGDKLALLLEFDRFACVAGNVALIFVARGSRRLANVHSRLSTNVARYTLTPVLAAGD
jgi:hypothetical protein